MISLERRYVTDDLAVRASSSGGKVITGHAAVFNKLSQNLGGFVEEVAPGAFTKTIAEADVRALFNHDPSVVLGRNRAGTLRLAEDNVGLHYEVELPGTRAATDLLESIERGDVTQSSFGFAAIDVEWGLTAQDFPKRRLLEVRLYDVSPVTYPAYLDTDVEAKRALRLALRSLADQRGVDLDDAVELARKGELRQVLDTDPDGSEGGPGAPTLLALEKRRLAHLGRRTPGGTAA